MVRVDNTEWIKFTASTDEGVKAKQVGVNDSKGRGLETREVNSR